MSTTQVARQSWGVRLRAPKDSKIERIKGAWVLYVVMASFNCLMSLNYRGSCARITWPGFFGSDISMIDRANLPGGTEGSRSDNWLWKSEFLEGEWSFIEHLIFLWRTLISWVSLSASLSVSWGVSELEVSETFSGLMDSSSWTPSAHSQPLPIALLILPSHLTMHP